MDQPLASEILQGDSDELLDIKANLQTLEGFIHLIQKLDSMPEVSKRFWEESRSLYQATCKNRPIDALEAQLSDFFGLPVKPADKPLPRKLNKESTIKFLGGVQKEQSLFLLHLKTGTFYGALWPWRRNKDKIEIHLGYCSDWMVDEDYRKLENLVKRSVSLNAFAQMDTQIGGQIRGIGLPSFLQMAEMEQSSFSLRITADGKTGILHVAEGKLMAAQTDQCTGREAAYRIISWDDAVIEITPIADTVSDDIQQPLMHILMESLKIKDEITSSGAAPAPSPLAGHKSAPLSVPKRDRHLVQLERVPPPPKPSRRRSNFLLIFSLVLAAIVLIGAGSLFSLQWIQNRRSTEDHTLFLDRLFATSDPETKTELLEQFQQSHPNSPHITEIETQIRAARHKFEDRDFDQTTFKISTLPIDEHYEQTAISLYSDFLEKYPESDYGAQISKSIKEIKNLLDQYYYEDLKQAARLDLSKRLEIYRDYVRRFPNGRYNTDVNYLIQEMGRNYLAFLQSQDELCTKAQRWDSCIQRYEEFIANFDPTDLAREAQRSQSALIDRRDLADLKKSVMEAGNDYQQAAQRYSQYLTQHPHTTQKRVIETELAQLQQQIIAQRQWMAVRTMAAQSDRSLLERVQSVDNYLRLNLASPYAGEAQELMNQLENQLQAAEQQHRRRAREVEVQNRLQKEKEQTIQRQQRVAQNSARLTAQLAGSQRYQPHDNATFTDLSTGAMWSLLDSYQELNGCLTYDAARTYVKALRHGGYQDWRLPSANELAALYKQSPFFPASEAQWYWTAESYAKGFHTVVTVVTSRPETVFERENRTEDQCGTVRAIRP